MSASELLGTLFVLACCAAGVVVYAKDAISKAEHRGFLRGAETARLPPEDLDDIINDPGEEEEEEALREELIEIRPVEGRPIRQFTDSRLQDAIDEALASAQNAVLDIESKSIKAVIAVRTSSGVDIVAVSAFPWEEGPTSGVAAVRKMWVS